MHSEFMNKVLMKAAMNHTDKPSPICRMRDSVGIINIDTEVVGNAVREFFGFGVSDAAVMAELNSMKGLTELEVVVNSPGGDVFSGVAIFNGIRDYAARNGIPVHTRVTGIAASIASVIALVGDTRELGSGAMFMVHKPYTMLSGNDEQMRKMADTLETVGNQIAAIYAERTKVDAARAVELMADESWIGGKDALELGFATIEDRTTDATANASRYIDYADVYQKMPVESFRNHTAELRNEVFNELSAARVDNMLRLRYANR